MDSIQLKTTDFVITIHNAGKITAQVTFDDGNEYIVEDITKTTLGKVLWLHYAEVFEQ
jgi:hypothetical protein